MPNKKIERGKISICYTNIKIVVVLKLNKNKMDMKQNMILVETECRSFPPDAENFMNAGMTFSFRSSLQMSEYHLSMSHI